MKFTYKSDAEISAMTPEERDAYATAKRAHEESIMTDKLTPLINEMAALKEEIAKLKEAPKGDGRTVKTLAEQLKANVADLRAIAKREGSKELNFSISKALSNRASITNNQQAVDLPNIGQLATRKPSLYDLFPKIPVSPGNHNGTIRFYDWDQGTIARAAAMVAEGGTFPESTAKFVKGALILQKIGDTLPVTEEFFEDEEMFAAELELFLQTNVTLEVDLELYSGDGTGNHLKGLIASVPAYTPVASGIPDASLYDLIPKVAESILTGGGSKYTVDFAVKNLSMINKMKLKKDSQNRYIMPPFAILGNQFVVDNVVVYESNVFADNVIVMGDSRFAKIYEMGGIEVAQGLVNAQFTADELTLRVRKRIAFLIRGADANGFKKVTDVDAALVTLAVVPS